MRVLLVEPGRIPEEKEIDGTLETMQSLVGGTIEALYPFDDEAALVCNDEGKLLGLPLNRSLFTSDGRIYDVVSGSFFICGLGEEDFASLSVEQLEHYRKRFASPEIILELGGQLVVVRQSLD